MELIIRDLLLEHYYYMDLAKESTDVETKRKYLKLAEEIHSKYATMLTIYMYRSHPELMGTKKDLKRGTVSLIGLTDDCLN